MNSRELAQIEIDAEESRMDKAIASQRKRVKETASTQTAQKKILWKQFDASVKKQEIPYKKLFVRILKEQEKEVLSNLEKAGVIVKGNIAGFAKQKVRVWLKEHKAKLDAVNIDKKEWEAKTEEIMKPAYLDCLSASGTQRMRALSRMKAEFTFNFESGRTKKWLDSRLRQFSKQVTGTTFDAIEATLQEGFSEGKPLAVIAEELRGTFDTAEAYRADLIARTEAVATYNEGEIGAIEQMGLEDSVKKFWINEPDARDTHQEAGQKYSEGYAIAYDDEFEVGDDSMTAPGNGSVAGENINCRCTLGWTKA